MTTKKTAPKKRRARTKTGHFKADDPKTPDVNEAWEVVEAKEEPKAKEPEPAPEPKKATGVVMYESRNEEPSMFVVAGLSPIRNFSTGRIEFKVQADDVERFEANHFVTNGRIVRKD